MAAKLKSTTKAKTTAKKPTAQKRKTAAKTKAPKTSAKKMMTAPTAQAKEPTNFMWRLLKKKEADRKLHDEGTKKLPFGSHQESLNSAYSRPAAFSKFAGPRRKVG